MTLLEIFVPTYNRPVEFEKCILSIQNALSQLALDQLSQIGVVIHDNSTKSFRAYQVILAEYTHQLPIQHLSYFKYRRTGFNIGSVNNILSGFLDTSAEYIWCLPDDDIARFDSLVTLLPILQTFRPSFVGGAWFRKSVIDYSSNDSGLGDGEINSILDVLAGNASLPAFLSKGVVQLQEYVYRVKPIADFLSYEKHIPLIDEMFPALLAIVCLRSSRRFVRLKYSLGIFREGDPRSEWRHRWLSLSLIQWPALSETLFQLGLLNEHECRLSTSVFRSTLPGLSFRPDILLGLNPRYKLNPFLLLRYHPRDFCLAIFRIPLCFPRTVCKKLRGLASSTIG